MKRLPYQLTLFGWFAVITAICVSIALFNGAAHAWPTTQSFFLALGGTFFLGGAIGAMVGHIWRDERGFMALLGAYLGALGSVALLFLLAVVAVAYWLFSDWI